MSFNESQLDIYNPGNIKITDNKNITLMYMVEDVDKEYGRLMNSKLQDWILSEYLLSCHGGVKIIYI